MEAHTTLHHSGIRLEAVINETRGPDGVVLTHPHPLYGGSMDNAVVTAVAGVFSANGFTTLRFNFRGVGNSTGQYDDGLGEEDDLLAALSFLKEKGCENIRIAGYSFGARISAGVVSKGCDIQDHIMISPPVAFMSFDDIERLPATGLVITGENDEIAPPDRIQSCLDRWRIAPRFEIIKSCDHFYSRHLKRLETILTQYLSMQPLGEQYV